MRRVAVSIIASALMMVGMNGAAANHSEGRGPAQDLVAGTGKMERFGTFVHVNAHADPHGTGANGSFFVRQTFFRLPLDFSGRVTCLVVNGNRATIGGEVTRNRPVAPGGVLPNPAVGSGVLIDVVDNDDNGVPDSANFTFRPAPPTVCPTLNSHQFPIDEGNFIVHDAASTAMARSATSASADMASDPPLAPGEG